MKRRDLLVGVGATAALGACGVVTAPPPVRFDVVFVFANGRPVVEQLESGGRVTYAFEVRGLDEAEAKEDDHE